MPSLNKITCIDDLRQVMARRVPKMFYEYCQAGSYTESTYRANHHDLQQLLFKQRVGCKLSNRRIRAKLLGQDCAMPVALAPIGIAGMQRANGEMLAAKAAADFGVPYTLSTMSICSMEDVAQYTDHAPFWFQLYVMRDRPFMKRLIERAQKANCSALVITLDLQVLGQRHVDIKNGLSAPPKLTLKNMLNMATKPQWCWQMLKTKRHYMGNIVGHVQGVSDMRSLATWTSEQFDPELSWDDIAWIKEFWGGPVILKGIMTPEDALSAVQVGADAIVVSNHGGRQLDGAPSTIRVLRPILQAVRKVGSSMQVFLDGGITSGQDVLRAMAMGANGTLIGRAHLYGLGAFGQAGVSKALDIIAKELDVSMAFCGHTNIADVTQDILLNPYIFDDDRNPNR